MSPALRHSIILTGPDLIRLLISAPVQETVNRENYARPNSSAFTADRIADSAPALTPLIICMRQYDGELMSPSFYRGNEQNSELNKISYNYKIHSR